VMLRLKKAHPAEYKEKQNGDGGACLGKGDRNAIFPKRTHTERWLLESCLNSSHTTQLRRCPGDGSQSNVCGRV
jgi:hypothetical protein